MKPIIVRGGGDLATGTIYRLSKSGYPVIILESGKPSWKWKAWFVPW